MSHRRTKSVFSAFFALLLFVCSIFSFAAPASALSAYQSNLLVSPGDITLGRLEPGKIYESEFRVKNIGTEKLNYRVYVTPYYEQGEEGEKVYTVSNHYTYLSEWISFDKTEGSLAPNASELVTFRAAIPENVAGGAQNAAIMVETNDSIDNSKVVSASGRVALILFSQINGETNACGKIIDKNIPGLLLNPPIVASGRVENCGNLDLNVKYTMEVSPIFSNEVIYTNEENPTYLATLPETRRYTKVEWEGAPSIGIFKVKLAVEYNGQTENLEKIVIVCPLWLIMLIIAFIGAVIFFLISRCRSRKNNKTGGEKRSK